LFYKKDIHVYFFKNTLSKDVIDFKKQFFGLKTFYKLNSTANFPSFTANFPSFTANFPSFTANFPSFTANFPSLDG